MDTSYNYVLVTKEESNVRVPKVLEDYLYSLHIFSDVISLENFTVERFRQSNSIYVITQMWLNIDENDRYFINEVLSKGNYDAGMGGGSEWKAFEISKEEYTKRQSERENFINIVPQNQKGLTPQQIQQKQFYFLVIA